MTYTFGISYHTLPKLATLQRSSTRATLMKIGFNRNTALAVVFGAVTFGGLGMRHLYVEQGIAQLQLFIRHTRAGTDQGTLLRITLAWWQLAAGVSYSLLEFPSRIIHHLDDNWLASVRNFLSFIDGTLHVDKVCAGMPQSARSNDSNLMDSINRLPKLTKPDSLSFNRCRLFMGVTHLSEIATASGTAIARDAWEGTRARHTTLLWPFQPKPGPDSFRIWRRLLADAFLLDKRKRVELRTKDLALRHPVGNWLPSSEWLQSKWTTFYSRRKQSVYSLDPTLHRYNIHSQKRRSRWTSNGRNSLHHAKPSDVSTSLPDDAVPVDAQIDTVLHFPSVARIRQLPTPPTPGKAASWIAYINRLPHWDHQLVSANVIPDLGILLNVIETASTLYLCSDGGAKDKKGSYGAVLATEDTILAEVGGRAHGANPRSFRAEGYGMLAILRLLFHLSHYWTLQREGTLLLLCDNAGLLQRVEKARSAKYIQPRRFLYSEADLEMQILDTLQLLQSTFGLEHILGHQDQDPDEPLTWKATLNVHCDAIATAQLAQLDTVETTVPFLPASKVALSIDGTTITHHIPTQIRQYYGHRLQQVYLSKHHHWEPSQFASVDWELFRLVILQFSLPKRFFLTKWVNLLLPFQSQQFRFNQSVSAACPSLCGCSPEDAHHFLRCNHATRVASFHALAALLATTFDRLHIDPYLRRCVISLLEPYTEAHTDTSELPPEYQSLLQSQRALGDDSLMFGFFHRSWIHLQHRYLLHMGHPCHKNQATTALKSWSTTIFQSVHDLWLLRNTHLHGSDPTSLHSYKRIQLLLEIAALYANKGKMLASDRDILSKPLEHWDDQSTTSLRSFLAFAKPVAQISLKQAADMGANFRPINDYFRPPIPQHIMDAICLNRSPPSAIFSQPEPD
jgi:hypothetical protein